MKRHSPLLLLDAFAQDQLLAFWNHSLAGEKGGGEEGEGHRKKMWRDKEHTMIVWCHTDPAEPNSLSPSQKDDHRQGWNPPSPTHL